ncbi:hypothetical protein IAU60_004007 [Kwoniella sp. DSM 27419]
MIRSHRLIRLSTASASAAASRRHLTTLGLRREDPKRIWERRTALTPDAIRGLLAEQNAGGKEELRVEVESCMRRCFADQLYAEAGARIVPTLSPEVDVVLGIKEPPVSEVTKLMQGGNHKQRKWMVFSHTHKGQAYNTPLLQSFMTPATGQSLIDHELLTAPSVGKDGKPSRARVAAFGWYAGAVGAGEALSLTGLALLKRGVSTPLLHLPRPYTAGSLAEFKAALRKCGDTIRALPDRATGGEGPTVIGLTGAGNVSSGSKDMLEELRVEWVRAEDLPRLMSAPTNKIYACAIPTSSYMVGKEGQAFDRAEYFASPDSYKSVFAEKIAPYLTTIINGVGWGAKFPRTITNEDLSTLIAQAAGKQKLIAVQDITCDAEGGLQFVNEFTTIDKPYFEGPNGILISSIDILPTELAADASKHFSSKVLPFVRRALFPEAPGDVAGETDTLERATIVSNGNLTRDHQWLQPRVDEWRANNSTSVSSSQTTAASRIDRGEKRKILLLGSGLVAGPAVEVFAARSDVHLAVASNNIAEARSHVRDRSNVQAISLDVSDEVALSEAVAGADVVVSLLPAPMHPQVAKHCIQHGKHLITASYVSPEMKSLDQAARESDVILLGECGLDPGIDSMAAMRILDRVKREGKRVTSFVSWCGGLPEPSASNVPLRYKFSWSPKAVLTAAQNDAHYKLNGEITKVAGDLLLSQHFPSVKLWDGLPLEGLANRDSMPYAEKYGLGPVESLDNLFRGTLRYQGFSKLLESFRRLGMLSSDALQSAPQNWEQFLLASASRQLGLSKGLSSRDLESALPDLIDARMIDETKEALSWFSLLPASSPTALPMPSLRAPVPIDLFAHLLSHKLAYAPGERDTCLLHHAFSLSSPGSDVTQEVKASLLCHGDEKASAMSVTVGKTLAFAALRVADGLVKGRGVMGPYEREVWEGTLDKLEEAGVVVLETWV